MEALDCLQKWAERFWFLRGITTAFLLFALIPEVTSVERYDFLRFVHAIIVGWNGLASLVGNLLGELPFVPAVDPDMVNTVLFAGAFGAPSAIALMMRGKGYVDWGYERAKEALEKMFSSRTLARIPWFKAVYFRALELYVENLGSVFTRLNLALVVLLVPALFYWVVANGNSVSSVLDPSDADYPLRVLLVATSSLIFVLFFFVALITFRGLAKGIFTAVTCVLTLEVLYFLNAPIIAQLVDTFADRVLGPDTPIAE